ncbi:MULTISPECIES: LysR family transcriptional regulator [unclassified Caballeronia]|uniref:LysR family transcriptional regulator n=1 Tax=unclassified Caballeronia TaxID=2646786 RepID=UPI0019D2CB5A|nr:MULTISPECIES: LysR family transcriptional regulator [unclassified Caballeronia]QSN65079.1 LysR family transcriptional regulator [Caballeronia sp. M1242]
MESFNFLESFVVTAQTGSFSAAARRLGMTPAGVSKNVARLEQQLGLRLFHRSTRSLTLTDSGESFYQEVRAPFDALRDAVSHAAEQNGAPSGTLKVSVGVGFGREYLVPILGEFLDRYPAIVPDVHFDNRPVDLIGEGYDAAIGGGIELNEGVVARELAPAHVIVVASPAYMADKPMPAHPSELEAFDGIARRSVSSGRVFAWKLRNAVGEQCLVRHRTRLIFDDPEAMAAAAMQGLGIALIPMPHAARWLQQGSLMRLLPGWFAELGAISLYYPSKKLLPPKTRVFVDFVVDAFRSGRINARLDSR